ncbi:MAG TPA: N-acetyltransferase [Desulfatiglandales bacterium]|nr:N-acetyltransferase [Desulfatiglandales bacterium]
MATRKASVKEVGDIHKMLSHYADQGLLLPRSLSEIYDHLRDYTVIDEINGNIIAVCALGVCWEDLGEIRSLAVVEVHQGKGIGTALIDNCMKEAASLGLKQVFALTYAPDFFAKTGFRVIEKSKLPHKIWADCLKCPKFPDCDETAMIREV